MKKRTSQSSSAAEARGEAALVDPGRVRLGGRVTVEAGVLLGYRPSRPVARATLRLGKGAHLRSGTVVYLGSAIGEDLQTGHHVVIREENRIGDHVRIWSNSIVDYGCRIGDRVKIHSNCYVAQFTVLEDDVFLAPGVSVANDIHPGCEFSVPCMKGPHLEKGVQVGVNVTLLPYVRIGAHSLIGAGAVVIRDVPPKSVVVGNPGRVIGPVGALKCSTGLTEAPYPQFAPRARPR